MSIVTDSKLPDEPKDPETCNVFALHKLFSKERLQELDQAYRSGSISYKDSKEQLAEAILAFVAPIQEKRAEIEARPGYVEEVLAAGREKASVLANQTLAEVYAKVGLA
jgi:tryptophanyl-tRNA synthetase